MPRHLTEEQKEKARLRTRRHRERMGYASQKAYEAKTVALQVRFHREKDADLIALFRDDEPMATQTKEMLRELIALRKRLRVK